MTPFWTQLCLGLGGALLGAMLATAYWWWASPKALLTRWSAPLRDALDAGFAEQALQQRLRSQGEKLWTRKQQNLLHESQESVHARRHAGLVTEIRRLVRSGQQEGGGVNSANASVRASAGVPSATLANSAATADIQDWTDAQLDGHPPGLAPPTGRRNRGRTATESGKPPLEAR